METKKIYITVVYCYLITIILSIVSCTSKNCSAETEMDILISSIEDSIRVMNVHYVKGAISRGKELAKDSDDYYNFEMYDAILYFYMAQADSMMYKMNATLDYLNKVPYTTKRNRLRIKCLQTKGAYYSQFQINPDSLIYYHIEACKAAEMDPEPEQAILCYNNLADSYKLNGDLDLSAEAYRKAILLADSVNTAPENYIPLYEGIASVYTSLHDFKQSEFWWNKSWELWDKMMLHEKFYYLNNRGNDYYYKGDYASCLNTFVRLDSLLSCHKDMQWEKYFCKVNLTDVYIKMGNIEKAEDLIGETYNYFKCLGNDVVLNYLNTQHMELSVLQKNYDLTFKLIDSFPLIENMRPDVVLRRYDVLRNFYSEKEMYKKAFYSEKAYNNLNDSLRNDRVQMRIADLQMQYEKDTTVLKQRIYIAKQEKRLMQINIWLFVSISLTILLLLLIYYRMKQIKNKEEQLLHRIVELRMENIRNRITPHFVYNALNHELLAQQEGRTVQLDSLVNLLRQGQALADVFCTTLKEELDFIYFYVMVEGASLGDGFKYEVNIADGLEPKDIRLPSMMVQIFVENAIKHGLKNVLGKNDKMLKLTVYEKNSYLHIEVFNNGPMLNTDYKNNIKTGLKVVSQTIQLLNEYNKQPMSYKLSNIEDYGGQSGCIAELIIPVSYNFNIR